MKAVFLTALMRLSLVFALAVALAGSGIAHRAPVAPVDEDIRAYLLAGGSYADVCGETDGLGLETCQVCLLIASAGLPPHTVSVPHCLSDARGTDLLATSVRHASRPDILTNAPRAPPRA